jgi:hypothetical protein
MLHIQMFLPHGHKVIRVHLMRSNFLGKKNSYVLNLLHRHHKSVQLLWFYFTDGIYVVVGERQEDGSKDDQVHRA